MAKPALLPRAEAEAIAIVALQRARRKATGPRWESPLAMAQALDPTVQAPAHLKLIDKALVETIAMGGRLMVFTPPRHGKSQLCSRWLPAWVVKEHPEKTVMLTSYGANFAADWGRLARDSAKAAGVQVRLDAQAVAHWITMAGGGMKTDGVGGGITGLGADVLICDDPIKNAAEAQSAHYRRRILEWWRSTATTRLEPGAAIVLIMTRWNEADLAGAILAECEADPQSEQWRVISLPALAEPNDPLGRAVGEALWPERYPVEVLQLTRRRIGAYWWSAQYAQHPTPLEGALWQFDWIEGARVAIAPQLERVVVGVDPAGSKNATSDETGVAVAGLGSDGDFYVLVGDGYRLSPLGWGSRVVGAYHAYECSQIAAEVNFGGDLVESNIRLVDPNVPIVKVHAMMGKTLRAEPVAALYEQGRVHHVGVLSELEDQMTSFPVANEHDDRVDALVYAISALMEPAGVGVL